MSKEGVVGGECVCVSMLCMRVCDGRSRQARGSDGK